jgi:hypothetical protein
MKNTFKLSSLLFIGVILFQVSCSEDPVTPPVDNTPNPVGKWQMVSATLVDGNAQTAEAEPLVIANLPLAGLPDGPIPVGDVQITSALVGGALAGTTCDDPASYASFFVELVEGGNLSFQCPDESAINPNDNKWVVLEDSANPGVYSLTLTVVVGGTALPITIINFEISADGSTFTGTAAGYPMVNDITMPIGTANIQFITTDLIFKSIP